ncbi:MAG: DUF819 family protein [Deltaproteobacteria bacterium]|nr:DUF819 family protein [Deltaproteobacteria bacterium]
MPLIQEPSYVFLVLLTLLGAIFFLSSRKSLKKIFDIIPPIFLAYLVPTLLSNFGVIPAESAFYVWAKKYLLPMSLFLILIGIDIPAILRLGPKMLITMLSGTLGVILGGPIAVALFKNYLHPDSWMGLAALAGSWIGGVSNFAAIAQGLQAPQQFVSPAIVIDTIVGFSWMALLMFFSTFQGKFDTWNRADTSMILEVQKKLEGFHKQVLRPSTVTDILVILTLGFTGGVLCFKLGHFVPYQSKVFSPTLWGVILTTMIAALLSFTPLRKLEGAGSTRISYAALYLLLTTMGAQADLRAVVQSPVYLAVGIVWLSIHIIFILIALRLLRAPLFFGAVGSMANIGGTVSCPIVAEVYREHMLPAGILMALVGTILGNYGGLLCGLLMKFVLS